jgi:hypothetical protein
MPDVIIKQSRPVGSGIVIAIIMLAAITLWKVGPELAGIDDERQERQRLLEINQNSRDDLKVLQEEFSKEGNAAQRFLEILPNRASSSDGKGTAAPLETNGSDGP